MISLPAACKCPCHQAALEESGQTGCLVPFTGALLLGERFITSTYVHMGFHPAWKFASTTM